MRTPKLSHWACLPQMQLYLECHYEAHAALIEAITEDSCRELCAALVPHVPNFYFWVGASLWIIAA